MKICPNCGNQLSDGAFFCNVCGANLANGYTGEPINENLNQQQWYENRQMYGADKQAYGNSQEYGSTTVNRYDHTAEFDCKDISENKVIAMLVYLMGTIGIIIARIDGSQSEYVRFHVRQALKILVCKILIGFITILLFWMFLVPIINVIAIGAVIIINFVLFVLKMICFFQICMGKAVEPVLIRDLPFLK